MAMSGVCSAGLATTALPAASAADTWPVKMASGKFHGLMQAKTPRPASASWLRSPVGPGRSSGSAKSARARCGVVAQEIHRLANLGERIGNRLAGLAHRERHQAGAILLHQIGGAFQALRRAPRPRRRSSPAARAPPVPAPGPPHRPRPRPPRPRAGRGRRDRARLGPRPDGPRRRSAALRARAPPRPCSSPRPAAAAASRSVRSMPLELRRSGPIERHGQRNARMGLVRQPADPGDGIGR